MVRKISEMFAIARDYPSIIHRDKCNTVMVEVNEVYEHIGTVKVRNPLNFVPYIRWDVKKNEGILVVTNAYYMHGKRAGAIELQGKTSLKIVTLFF